MSHHHSHDHGHGHDHHHGPTPARALWVAFSLNAIFLVLEAIAGWWTNSLALLSDAGHMLSDVAALAIALGALHLAERAPTTDYTFGLKRAPVLGGLLNGASLVVIVALVFIEAFERLDAPPPLDANVVLWTGIAGLAVNLGSAWYLARSRDESVNTRGAMLHLLSDAFGSIAAIGSAIAVSMFGWALADVIASSLIALLILLSSLPLLRDTFTILLQRAPRGANAAAIRALLGTNANIQDIIDLKVWELDAGQPVVSAILTTNTDSLTTSDTIADTLREQLKESFGVTHATIELRRGALPNTNDS